MKVKHCYNGIVSYRFNEEQIKFIVDNYKAVSTIELTDLVNTKYGLSVTIKQMRSFMHNHRLYNGRDTKFKKGHVSHNTGKKGICFSGCEKGWFKKGHTPHNHLPVGFERLLDGYAYIKIAEPNVWELKHRIVYEQHYGKLEDGDVVVFLDGDRGNITIDNLKKITRAELSVMNHQGWMTDNADITDCNYVRMKLLRKIKEMEKLQNENMRNKR